MSQPNVSQFEGRAIKFCLIHCQKIGYMPEFWSEMSDDKKSPYRAMARFSFELEMLAYKDSCTCIKAFSAVFPCRACRRAQEIRNMLAVHPLEKPVTPKSIQWYIISPDNTVNGPYPTKSAAALYLHNIYKESFEHQTLREFTSQYTIFPLVEGVIK